MLPEPNYRAHTGALPSPLWCAVPDPLQSCAWRRRRAQPRWSGRAAHRASFPIAFATDSMVQPFGVGVPGVVGNSRQKLARRPRGAFAKQCRLPPRFKGMYQRRVRKCSQPFPSVAAALRLAPKCGLRTPARTPRRPAPSAQEPPNRTRRACASRARRAMETVDLKLVLLGTSRRAHPGPALPWRGTPVVRVAPRAPRSSGSLQPVHSAAAGRPQTPLCPLLRRSARRG